MSRHRVVNADRGSRWINVDDLVGVAELADEYGCGNSAISNWRTRYDDFPAPVKELAAGLIFDRTEVRAWHDSRKWLASGPRQRNGVALPDALTLPDTT